MKELVRIVWIAIRRIGFYFVFTAFNILFFCICGWTAQECGHRLLGGHTRFFICEAVGLAIGILYIALITIGMMQRISRQYERRKKRHRLYQRRTNRKKKTASRLAA